MRTLILFALTLLAQPALAKPTPNAVKEALLAAKCDLAAHGVRTPFGASVLRNTPYALAGYTFKSEGLRALFSADGDWYVPKGKATFDGLADKNDTLIDAPFFGEVSIGYAF